MTKKKLIKFIQENYTDALKESDDWISEYESKNKDKPIYWPTVFAKYLKNTISLKDEAGKLLLKGNPELTPVTNFNLTCIKTFQDIIVKMSYRYAMLNRRTQTIVNPWLNMEETDLEQAVESIISNGFQNILERDYLPPYVQIVDKEKGVGIIIEHNGTKRKK